MLLHITGSTKKNRVLVNSAAWYFAEKLMGKRLLDTLEININLKHNMSEKTGCEGTAIWTFWDDLKKTPRDFTLELDSSMSIRNILINLAHEMVHVKQFTRGELKHTTAITAKRWHNKEYNESNYWNCPWEIEAYGRELGLFTMWVEKLDIKGKFTEDPT